MGGATPSRKGPVSMRINCCRSRQFGRVGATRGSRPPRVPCRSPSYNFMFMSAPIKHLLRSIALGVAMGRVRTLGLRDGHPSVSAPPDNTTSTSLAPLGTQHFVLVRSLHD